MSLRDDPDPDPPAARRRCLLIVEDEPDIAYFLGHWLERRGLRSVWAGSVHEAQQMLRDLVFIEAQVDGLLADYRLPDATGCRVVQAFMEEFPGLPVALMTAYHDISLSVWVRAHSIPLFRKPLELTELEQWLAEPPAKPHAREGRARSGDFPRASLRALVGDYPPSRARREPPAAGSRVFPKDPREPAR